MHYIYDILVDLKKELYDFYDWNKEDKILNLRKTPIFKVRSKVLHDFSHRIVRIDPDFFTKIYNKTDAFYKNCFHSLPYVCILTDSKKAFVFEFKDNQNLYISSMLFDEEEEVIDISKKMEWIEINYQVIRNRRQNLKTRKEIKKIQFINRELQKINESKLRYLYLEYFGQKGENKNQILVDIQNHLEDRIFLNQIYEFFRLTSNSSS